MNSRNKGKGGELEWARFLNDRIPAAQARRGQQFSGGPDSPDVVSTLPFHFEVKRTERLHIEKAIEQAERDCDGDMPVVAYRRNRGQWLVVMRAVDFIELLRREP